jgi:hypothetical protein
MDRNKKRIKSIFTAAMILILTCCNFPGRSQVEIIIESHEDGQAVVLNKEIHIVSHAVGSKGISAIELYANDTLIDTSSPPIGSPDDFTADQAWTPQEEGPVVISVLAKDMDGNTSKPFSIVLNVVPTISEMDATPTITLTPEDFPQTLTAQVGCTNGAVFMEHVTIPPNTTLSTGSNFTKTWRLLNDGSCDWIGYELVHISGSLLSASSPQALALVNAGYTVDISVEMAAPTSPGTYSAAWRLRDPEGNLFGPELTLTIIVPAPETDTPTPTSTFTLTATPTRTSTPTPTITPTQVELSVKQVNEQVSISPGAIGSTTAACPAGSVVVSGGFAADPQLLIYTQSKNGNGWRVYAKNNSAATKLLYVYATCLVNSGGSISQLDNQVSALAGGTAHVVVSCPAGSVVTGGGWATESNGDIWVYNSSKSSNGWQIYARNSGTESHLINVYAMCLSGVSGSTQNTMEPVSIPAGDTGYALAFCPSGTYVVGGGFACQDDLDVYNSSDRSLVDNGWINYAFNTGSVQRTMYTFTICYSP